MDHAFELYRHGRSLFTSSAQGYDDGRPGYPPELFELLIERCGLGPGCQFLEIGPGTGQATGPLFDSGATVVGVELGTELAELLRRKHADRDLEVIVGPFEEVALPDVPFDLVAAGTSFHWVPVETGLRRCAESLRVGGFLALWWNYFGDPERPDPFHQALQPLLRRHAPQLIDVASAGNAGTGAHPYALDCRGQDGPRSSAPASSAMSPTISCPGLGCTHRESFGGCSPRSHRGLPSNQTSENRSWTTWNNSQSTSSTASSSDRT